MALAALFGKRKTPEEMLRQNQRALNKVKCGAVCVCSLWYRGECVSYSTDAVQKMVSKGHDAYASGSRALKCQN